ncbi:MAG TPA: hypothetical protein VFR08_03995 [Candidatus Angelobacter sp.]|nr:hypothetical protein [Candidatus Angelobacter sp.]
MSSEREHTVSNAFAALKFGVELIVRGMTTWVSAVILCTAIAFWHINTDIETIVPRLIFVLACVAAIQAARHAGYLWGVAVGGIAVIFNPFVPNVMSRIAIFGLYFACFATALLGLAVLRFGRRQPVPVSVAFERRVALDGRHQEKSL